MKLNFIGVAQTLIAVENTEKAWALRLFEGKTPVPLGGLVFTLALTRSGGGTQFTTLQVQEDAVLWRLPALAAGHYAYELFAQDDTGSRERMFYGALEVVPSAAVQQVAELGNAPVMEAFLGDNGRMRWQWSAGNAAAFYAAEARHAAEDALGAQQRVAAIADAVHELQRFVESFYCDVASVIRIVDGVWVIGDFVSQQPAQGPRGMNADEFEFHMIEGEAELPTDAEHCNSHHRYVVRGTAQRAAVEFPKPSPLISWYAHGISFNIYGREFTFVPPYTADDVVRMLNAGQNMVTASYSEERFTFAFEARAAGAAGNDIWVAYEAGPYFDPELGDHVDRDMRLLKGGSDEVGELHYVWVDNEWRALSLHLPQLATGQVYGLSRLGTDNTVVGGLPVGADEHGRMAADVRSLALPYATIDRAGAVRLARGISTGDVGAALSSQVAEELGKKQDVLDFQNPDSEVNRAIARAVADAVANVPLPKTGDVLVTFAAVAPAGYLALDGQRGLSREGIYGPLFDFLVTNGVTTGSGLPIADSGDGATTFDLPDMSGCFMRFLGAGREFDAGRTAGSFQAGAVPNITGHFAADGLLSINAAVADGVFSSQRSGETKACGITGYAGGDLSIDASRVSPVYKNDVTEVRPANVALYAYIKY